MSFKRLSVKQTKELIEDNDITIIDIRDSQSYSMGHIDNAMHADSINIENFFPGKALNDGIRVSKGNYIVCISAHCIPQDKFWLKNLYNN